jgi:phage tail tape-measure protein
MTSDGPLIFIGVRPFSAQFYSHGQAIKVVSSEQAWRRIGVGAGYVATFSGDLFIASAAELSKTGEPASEASAAAGVSALPRRVARMGHYGHYDLLFVAAR